MSCSVLIHPEGVIGITGQNGLNAIRVTGTSSACGRIQIQVSCDKAIAEAIPDAPSGDWEALIILTPDQKCTCGTMVRYVRATGYPTDGTGTPCVFDWTGVLECRSDGSACPRIVDIITEIGPCEADGTRKVSLTPVLDPENAVAEYYHWEYGTGDGAEETLAYPPSDQGSWPPGPPGRVTHSYAAPGTGPSEYQVALTITNPKCPIDQMVDTLVRPLLIPGCSASCPTIEDVTAHQGRCVSRTRRRVILDAAISGGTGAFTWNYGDPPYPNDPVGSSDPVTTHVYETGHTYTATLTMMPSGGCPEVQGSVTFTVTECSEFEWPSNNDHHNSDDDGTLCGLLFKLMITAIILAAVAMIVTGCLWATQYFGAALAATAWLVAAAVAAFLLWYKVCGRSRGKCRRLHQISRTLGWMDTATLVAGAIGTVLGLLGIAPSALPCSLGALVSSGFLASARNTIHRIAEKVGCLAWRA
jgi:hypothetical protein